MKGKSRSREKDEDGCQENDNEMKEDSKSVWKRVIIIEAFFKIVLYVIPDTLDFTVIVNLI